MGLRMRGSDGLQEERSTFSRFKDSVSTDHPPRSVRALVKACSKRLDGMFSMTMTYATAGRTSSAPENLVLLQVSYSVRSERQLMQETRCDLLVRWFVGLAIDDAVQDHSVFSKNRERILEHEVIEAFSTEVMRFADKAGLFSKEHMSIDGTVIQARASHKTLKPRVGSDDQTTSGPGPNGQADWKGRSGSNDTHINTTDPNAQQYRKSHKTTAIQCCQGHVLTESQSGLVVGAVVTHADGFGEPAAALAMLDAISSKPPRTRGAEKA